MNWRYHTIVLALVLFTSASFTPPAEKRIKLSKADYEDRVQAIWTGQILGALMGFPFEHKVASVKWIDKLKLDSTCAPVDDDWYYEMVAIRAFEKYGSDLSVAQLGEQWLENSAGTWGSSEQARLNMQKGISAPDCGHPRYNKLWHTIGPQFSCDVYGALAPGMPNLAASLARNYGHINGYAEGVDGGVFVASMISLGFTESDPKAIVRKAATIIHPASPYRQCLDMLIGQADKGRSFQDIIASLEYQWRIDYPATNNAVPNGAIVAASLWFGEGDFLKTINLAFGAADFTDADCNAANAAAVIGAMKGMKAIPADLTKLLNDRIAGDKLGTVVLTPSVNETISGLARRTVAVGLKLMQKSGAKVSGGVVNFPAQQPVTQPAELFTLSDLTKYWNPDWTLERAGFGGAGGGMPGLRGLTFLDDDVLATYPRDEVKTVVLTRDLTVGEKQTLSFDAGVDSGRVWRCEVYADNNRLLSKMIEGNEATRKWIPIRVDLSALKGSNTKIRIYQRVLITGRPSGNAYWRKLEIQ